jgi:hypothetical protein
MTDFVHAIVARGVIRGVGLDETGTPSFAAPTVETGPGGVVLLEVDEANRLKQTGALVSPPIATMRRNAPAT